MLEMASLLNTGKVERWCPVMFGFFRKIKEKVTSFFARIREKRAAKKAAKGPKVSLWSRIVIWFTGLGNDPIYQQAVANA
jgi:hypothetical protein